MLKYWFFIIGFLIFVVIFPVNIYLAKQMRKIKKIKEMKNKSLSWIISFVFFYITIILLIWNMTNGYVIMLHVFFFVLFGELLYKLFRVIKKKDDFKYGQEITLAVSIFFSILYLGYGYYLAHHVVETRYVIETEKDLGVDSFRIVQVTDSHIGATMNGEGFYNYMIKINELSPDIVVVTGDFVDDGTTLENMKKACAGLGALDTKYGVYFVYGNHDEGYMNNKPYKNSELKEELLNNNVVILEDQGLDVVGNIYLIGRKDKRYQDRKSIQELMVGVDDYKYVIDLNHQPNDYKNESDAKVDLVISGHTHGGQLFPLQFIDLGANNMMYGSKKSGDTTFIVSSGIGDWEVKFRSFSKAEYVVIDLISRK